MTIYISDNILDNNID